MPLTCSSLLPPPDTQAGCLVPGNTGPFCLWRACPHRQRARQREPGHRPLCCAGTSHQQLPGTGRCADRALDRRIQAGSAAICRQRGQDLYPGPVFTGCRGRARGTVRKPTVRGQRRVALAGQQAFFSQKSTTGKINESIIDHGLLKSPNRAGPAPPAPARFSATGARPRLKTLSLYSV